MDIEFIVQTLQLLHAHARPDILDANTIAALNKLAAAGLLDGKDAALLLDAARLQQSLTQTVRIALDETLRPAEATPALKALLARAGDAPDFAALEKRLAVLQAGVRAVFIRLTSG